MYFNTRFNGVDGTGFNNDSGEKLVMDMITEILKGFNQIDAEQNNVVTDTVKPKNPVTNKYNKKVKFSYYGNMGNHKDHGGVITIASCVDDVANIVSYGVSYCSPKDQYDKHIGKAISYEDMNTEMKMVELHGKTHHKINARIFSDIVANADAPSWAENRIAMELGYHLINAFDVRNVK